jgi:hypothetical protein
MARDGLRDREPRERSPRGRREEARAQAREHAHRGDARLGRGDPGLGADLPSREPLLGHQRRDVVAALASDLQTALDDPNVEAILFNFDSPGGEVNGIHEFAEQIAAARVQAGRRLRRRHGRERGLLARESRPATSRSTRRRASARSAWSGAPEAGRRRPAPSRSSRAVAEQAPDVTTKDGRATVQATVDAIAKVFVDDVARFRGVDAKVVEKDFGQGGVLVGEAARAAGMVDRVGSFESAVVALRTKAERSNQEQHMKRVNRALGLAEDAHEDVALAAVEKKNGGAREVDERAEDRERAARGAEGDHRGPAGKVQRAELEAFLDGAT